MDFFRAVPKQRNVKIRGNKGIIFYSPSSKRKVIFGLGNGVLIGGLIYLSYLYAPLFAVTGRYYYSQKIGNKPVTTTQVGDTQPVIIEKAAENYVFELQIPRLLASAQIVPNVSPFDSSLYLKALEDQKVAQAEGSANPGDGKGKTVFIFAHSTQQGAIAVRNNAVFYLLGEMKTDDPIYISYKGKVHTYRVYQQKVVSTSEIKYLSYKEDDSEVLILQTCWPIGTDWKRLLVFAKRV